MVIDQSERLVFVFLKNYTMIYEWNKESKLTITTFE